MEPNATFVLIRVAGRGNYRIYHRLGADDSRPACGAQIQGSDWDIVTEQTARRPASAHAARRCCTWCMQSSNSKGEPHHGEAK